MCTVLVVLFNKTGVYSKNVVQSKQTIFWTSYTVSPIRYSVCTILKIAPFWN